MGIPGRSLTMDQRMPTRPITTRYQWQSWLIDLKLQLVTLVWGEYADPVRKGLFSNWILVSCEPQLERGTFASVLLAVKQMLVDHTCQELGRVAKARGCCFVMPCWFYGCCFVMSCWFYSTMDSLFSLKKRCLNIIIVTLQSTPPKYNIGDFHVPVVIKSYYCHIAVYTPKVTFMCLW